MNAARPLHDGIASADLVVAPFNDLISFVRAFVGFSRGKIVSDGKYPLAGPPLCPVRSGRRVRIDSTFGKIAVLVTDGQLSYPYGRPHRDAVQRLMGSRRSIGTRMTS